MPNIKIDTGVARRFKSYTHKSKFTEEKSIIDESKNIYLKDINLINNLEELNLLDAWFDILAKNSNKWLKGQKIVLTQNFLETSTTILDSNDIFKDFVDKNIEFTNDDKRISKEDMHKKFLEMYPQKHLTVLQVINSLKEKKLIYNAKFRCNNIQGCFINVKFRDFIDDKDDEDDKPSPLDGNYINYKQKYELLEQEMKKLKEQYGVK
jgi:hypothetical protein